MEWEKYKELKREFVDFCKKLIEEKEKEKQDIIKILDLQLKLENDEYSSQIPYSWNVEDEGRNEILARLNNAIENKQISDYVWSTPGLPMLIFVTIGVIISILFGDIIWMLISSLLS